MSEEHSGDFPDDAELPTCSVEEAFERDFADIEVPEGDHLSLRTARSEFARHFARIRVDGFNDLQALGLIPRGLKEEVVRSAISSDDQEALRLTQETLVRRSPPQASCGCHAAEERPRSFGRDLKTAYRDVRKAYHPALSKLLSERFKTSFSWDSILAGTVHQWTRRIAARDRINITALFAQDITIRRRSTLVLDETSTVLLARAIRIHRTGRLIHRGGFLRIWANSLESFVFDADFLPVSNFVPWRLER